MTRTYYRQIVEEALAQAKSDYEASPELSLNQSFYHQLLDIKQTVIEENKVYTLEEAQQKYPLGVMAVRNFDGYDESWPYPSMLMDVSYGISRYPEMPEE